MIDEDRARCAVRTFSAAETPSQFAGSRTFHAQVSLVNAAAMVAVAERDQVFGVVGAVLGTKDDVMRFEPAPS